MRSARAGCSSSDDDAAPGDTASLPDTDADTPGTAEQPEDDAPPTAPPGVQDPGIDAPPTAVPPSDGPGEAVDPDGDDRPGLVVEGLGGLPPDQVTSQWFVEIELFRSAAFTPGSGDVYVDFTEYADPLDASTVIDFYTPAIESCIADGAATSGDDDGSVPPQISAGDTVVINTPSGPWFTLDRMRGEFGAFYLADDTLPGALPAGATLSAPGDAFPTVAAYPLVEPEPPVRVSPPADEPLQFGGEYTWVAGDDPTAVIKLDLEAYDDTGEFVGFRGRCEIRDDGSFTMPTAIDGLADNAGETLTVRLTRAYSRVDVVDGIFFRQYSEIAE